VRRSFAAAAAAIVSLAACGSDGGGTQVGGTIVRNISIGHLSATAPFTQANNGGGEIVSHPEGIDCVFVRSTPTEKEPTRTGTCQANFPVDKPVILGVILDESDAGVRWDFPGCGNNGDNADTALVCSIGPATAGALPAIVYVGFRLKLLDFGVLNTDPSLGHVQRNGLSHTSLYCGAPASHVQVCTDQAYWGESVSLELNPNTPAVGVASVDGCTPATSVPLSMISGPIACTIDSVTAINQKVTVRWRVP
jgi:hypothetical protein